MCNSLENITKHELKIRLKIIGLSLSSFLEEIGYNRYHLGRYKEDVVIPNHFKFALLYLEEKANREKMVEVLDEYKKVSSQMSEDEHEKKVGENCIFWNKNSDFLLVGELEKKIGEKFKMKGHSNPFDFAEKYIGVTPKKFFVQYFSNGVIIKPKVAI
jgi:hypothetical protein